MPKVRDLIALEQFRALNELGLQMEVQARRERNRRAQQAITNANDAFVQSTDPLVEWTAPNGDVLVDRKSVIRDIIASGSWR